MGVASELELAPARFGSKWRRCRSSRSRQSSIGISTTSTCWKVGRKTATIVDSAVAATMPLKKKNGSATITGALELTLRHPILPVEARTKTRRSAS
jgi:ribosomal protein L21E